MKIIIITICVMILSTINVKNAGYNLSPPTPKGVINNIKQDLLKDRAMQEKVIDAIDEVDSRLGYTDRLNDRTCQLKAFKMLKRMLPEFYVHLTWDAQRRLLIEIKFNNKLRYYIAFRNQYVIEPEVVIYQQIVHQEISYMQDIVTRNLRCSH